MVLNSACNILVTISSLLSIKKKEKCDILKLVVWTLIKASIPNLKTNIKYIHTYRHKSLMSSEDDFFLTLLEKAITFVEGINLSSIKLDDQQQTMINLGEEKNLSSNSSKFSIKNL